MSQLDRSQLIPDPQQPSRQPGGIQSPRPLRQPMVNSTARQIPPRAPIRASISSVSSVPHMAPVTTRALRTLEFLTTAAPPTTDPQRAIRRAARRRSSSSSALSLSSISWASWRFRRLPTQHHHRRVDISFSNASSAATKVNSAWKHYKLTVSGEDFSWTYQPESDEPIVDGEAAAHEIIGSNEPLLWPSRLIASLGGKNVSATKNGTIDLEQDVDLSMLSDAFDQKQFEEDLGAAIDAFNEGRTGTFEASSSYDEKAGKFTIEKARSNEKLNREHVIKYAEIELASLSETVDLTKLGNDAYEPLNGTLTNDQIQAACDAANNFLGVNVTLKLNGNDAGKVDGSSVLQWISFADPANPTLDTSQISNWAADLANGFNTVGSTRWWTRADGKQCAVEGGDFGWSIDSSTLAKQVEDAINNKQTGEIEINYSQKADTFTAKGEPDWKAYIDVDLSEQHARYYDESGNIVWEANFISGKPGEDATPEGVWQINSNDGATKLIGAKDPKTGKPKYESPVSYWMPFEGNMVGFHDATWQNDSSFDSAESYKWCGSHGCINLRLADAKALHDCIKVGLCVVVHS